MMADENCAATRRWLAEGDPAPPPADLAAHVAGCARCRGALAATLAGLIGPPPPADAGCAACEEDLPAALDLERAQGASAAARRYPHVWWHLWTCADCAEIYQATASLLDAEAVGLIDAPPRLAAAPAPALRLARSFLHQVFAPHAALGPAWGDDAEPMLVAEDDLPGCRIAIYVSQTAADRWTIELQVNPPIQGDVVIAFGASIFRARLDAGRSARIGGLPTELLTNRAGPDMLISIERGGGDDAGS
jgi:hypothetical protein